MENLVDQRFPLFFRQLKEFDTARLTDEFQLRPVPFHQKIQSLEATDQLLECRPSTRW
jgi:hypothetical protein